MGENICRKCEGFAGGVHITLNRRNCRCECGMPRMDRIYGQLVCDGCGHSLDMPHARH